MAAFDLFEHVLRISCAVDYALNAHLGRALAKEKQITAMERLLYSWPYFRPVADIFSDVLPLSCISQSAQAQRILRAQDCRELCKRRFRQDRFLRVATDRAVSRFFPLGRFGET